MTWEDEEFEQFLKQFRLKQSKRTLPAARAKRAYPFVAVAAAVLAILTGFAGVHYLRTAKPSSPSGSLADPTAVVAQATDSGSQPGSPALTQQSTEPPEPSARTLSPAASAETMISPNSEPPQRKLAPEPETLTTTRVLPAPESSSSRSTARLERGASSPQGTEERERLRQALRGEAEDEAGRRIVERACGSCHVPTLIGNSHWSSAMEYRDFLNSKVVTAAAQLTPEEIAVASNYLFRTYGTPQQPPVDNGKTVFNASCTQCHAADVMNNHVYADPLRYRQIVEDMIGKGALVAEPQITPLVDYLLRTYGSTPRFK